MEGFSSSAQRDTTVVALQCHVTPHAVPLADESQDDDRRWAGVARVAGPVWTRLPSLAVGLFGVAMLWSVEMSYSLAQRNSV